jgi:predicted nucleic acid-binding protein
VTIKAILDTNVIISGIFWKGAPFEILKAWQPANHRALFIAGGTGSIPVTSTNLIQELGRVNRRLLKTDV